MHLTASTLPDVLRVEVDRCSSAAHHGTKRGETKEGLSLEECYRHEEKRVCSFFTQILFFVLSNV